MVIIAFLGSGRNGALFLFLHTLEKGIKNKTHRIIITYRNHTSRLIHTTHRVETLRYTLSPLKGCGKTHLLLAPLGAKECNQGLQPLDIACPASPRGTPAKNAPYAHTHT